MLEHPRIPYAARYGVGTISRKPLRVPQRLYATDPPQADQDKVRSLWRHRVRFNRSADKKPALLNRVGMCAPVCNRGLRLTIGGNLYRATLSIKRAEGKLCLPGGTPLRERVARGGKTVGFPFAPREVPTRTNGITVGALSRRKAR